MVFIKKLKHLTSELRNRRSTKSNWKKFKRLVKKNRQIVYKHCDLRWMISICDTFVDHANKRRGSRALSITMFFTMLRLSESVKCACPANIEPKSVEFKILYDGMTTFGVDKQDTFLNLSRRAYYILSSDSFLFGLWSAMINKMHNNKTVIFDFSSQSKVPERYMPLNPRGIKDNYGYIYEDLYSSILNI